MDTSIGQDLKSFFKREFDALRANVRMNLGESLIRAAALDKIAEAYTLIMAAVIADQHERDKTEAKE